MSGINKVIIVGRLGQDPETPSDKVTKISVATSESWNDKASGEKKTQTEWHQIIFFGRMAGVASTYLTKGSQVYIEGKLETKKWTDNQGINRYTTQILANKLEMLGGGNQEVSPSSSQGYSASPKPSSPVSNKNTEIDFSSEIPF